jgi:hypothetical protein
MKKTNPDDILSALEKVCLRFNVAIVCRKSSGDVVIYDSDGAEVLMFDKLSGSDGPANLEIGHSYVEAYHT